MPEDMEKTKREIMHMTEAEQTLARIERTIERSNKRKKSPKNKPKPKKKTSKKPEKVKSELKSKLKSKPKKSRKAVVSEKRSIVSEDKPLKGEVVVENELRPPEKIEKKGGVFSRFKLAFRRVVNKLFWKRKEFKLGIYGPTNAGKTTLANVISMDWLGEEVGTVSEIPHETRHVQSKENIMIKSEDGRELMINLVDTPGISTKVDFEEFVKFGMTDKDAKSRAREATQGIIEAIKFLDQMDVVLAVMDSTKSPYNQVNLTILGNLEARKIPVIIVANKIDLKKANINALQATFPQYPVVGVSAKDKMNIDKLYQAIFDLVK